MFRSIHGKLAGRLAISAGLVLGGGVCLVVLASCNQPRSQAQPKVLPRSGQPVMHAVYADELRNVMRELNTQASQRVWMQMYTSGEMPVDMSQMVDTADKLAQVAANRLPQSVANVQMDPTDRQIFLGLSKRLHDEAVVLKQQAQTNQLIPAQATMNEIINTCNSCHTMFRSVAGPI